MVLLFDLKDHAIAHFKMGTVSIQLGWHRQTYGFAVVSEIRTHTRIQKMGFYKIT